VKLLATKSGSTRYVPDRGDIVALTFDPQAGHEQAGRRPAVVLSPAIYNERSGLAVFAPVTNQVKDYPFEVAIPSGLAISGVVLADQMKSLDWRARKAKHITKLPPHVLREILQKATALVAPSG
jgi:mRNA interferase MazF